MYDKMYHNIGKLIKLKGFFDKNLRYNERHTNTIRISVKKKVKTFSEKNWWFLYNISDNMEIHARMLKFEDFYGNLQRYNGRHTHKII